jgi:hypothetical protein
MNHNHNHAHHGEHHMEHTEQSSAAVSANGADNALHKDISPSITSFLTNMAKHLTHSVTTGELILFIAAVSLIPLFFYEMMTYQILGQSAILIGATLPVIFFAIGFYFNRESERAIGIFFHSAAAVGLIMAAVLLIPALGAFNSMLLGYDGVAVGMPLLTLLFLFAAARLPNTGASYLLAAAASIVIFFYSTATLVTMPCITETYGGNPEASAYCKITPVLANVFLPLALYVLGYFTYTKRNK